MSNKKLLEKQIALVTGGNSGIGAGIAKALGSAGAQVIVNYVSTEDTSTWSSGKLVMPEERL